MNISARSGPRSAAAIVIAILAMFIATKAFAADSLTAPQLSLKCGTERTVVVSNPNQVGVIVAAANKTGDSTSFLAEQPLAAGGSVDVVVPAGYDTISAAFYYPDHTGGVKSDATLAELAANCPSAPTQLDLPATPQLVDDPSVQGDAHYVAPADTSVFDYTQVGTTVKVCTLDGSEFKANGSTCYTWPVPADTYNPPPSSGDIVWGKQGSDKASPSCLPGQATLFHFALSGGGKIGNAGTGTATFIPSGTDSAAGEIKGAGGAAHYYVGGDYNATVTSFIVSGATWIGDKPFLKLLDSGCVGDPTPEPTPSTTDSPSPSPVKQAVPGSGAPKTGGGGSSPVNTLVVGSVLAFGISIGIGLVLVLGTWRRKTVRA